MLTIDEINHLQDLYDQALKDLEEAQRENEFISKQYKKVVEQNRELQMELNKLLTIQEAE